MPRRGAVATGIVGQQEPEEPEIIDLPESIDALRRCVAGASAREPLRLRGAGTKAPLSAARPGERSLGLAALPRTLEYDPAEFTVTVSAATPVAELQASLAEHDQWLAFEPLLPEVGATVGGTVAANAGGAARGRFGGVRDAVLEVVLVNGSGELVRSGGRVVKNAAGFDFPKLLVGSCGALGALVTVTLKVLPRPAARWIGVARDLTPGRGAELVQAALGSPEEPTSVELEGRGLEHASLILELAGPEASLEPRARALSRSLDFSWSAPSESVEELRRRRGELAWAGDAAVARVPVRAREVGDLLATLSPLAPVAGGLRWTYSGGRELLVAVDREALPRVDATLRELGLSGLALAGPPPGDAGSARLGIEPTGGVLLERVRAAFDPRGVFAGP